MFCILFCYEVLKILQRFVVQAMQFWSISSDAQIAIDIVVCCNELGSVLRLNGVGFDEVGIYNIEEHNVIVTSVGCDGKTTGLVGEQLPFGLSDSHENHIGFVVIFGLFGQFHGVYVLQRGSDM